MVMVTRCHMNVTCVKKFSTPRRILKSINWHIVMVMRCHMIVTCVRKYISLKLAQESLKKLEVAELKISSGDFLKLVTWSCLSCIVFKTSSKISFLLLCSTQPHSQPSPRPVPAGGQDSPNFKCSLLWLSLLTFLGDHNAALLAGPISTFVVHCHCCCSCQISKLAAAAGSCLWGQPAVWQCSQLSSGYLAMLLTIWQWCWLPGSAGGYLAVLLSIMQSWWLSGSAAGYPAVLLAFWQCC